MQLAVKYLLIANTAIFLFQELFRIEWQVLLGLTPVLLWKGYIWQPVTYMFLHAGFFHLLFNMFVLWMFGSALESTWGTRRFLKFYFICGVGAGLLNALVTPGSPIPTVGSSGAIYGLLLAFGILFPNQLIYIWGIFPVKAKHFVVFIGIIELMSAMSTSESKIAHFAHLGGMLFGLVYLKWDDWMRPFSGQLQEKKRGQHLKKVWDREKEMMRLRDEIDELLDKLKRNGIDSLTPDEHKFIKKASRKLEELEKKE